MTLDAKAGRRASVLTTIALALSLLFVAPGTASAAEPSAARHSPTVSYDKLPAGGRGSYTSDPTANGPFTPAVLARQPGGTDGWGVRWIKGGDTTVRLAIGDYAVDGKQAIVVVRYNDGRGVYAVRELTILTDEPRHDIVRSTTFAWKKGKTAWLRQSVSLQVCNGRDAYGKPTECGAPHGPIHAY